jgi:hypothetical protein
VSSSVQGWEARARTEVGAAQGEGSRAALGDGVASSDYVALPGAAGGASR